MNKLQWNSKSKYKIFIQENAFENVVFEMAAILSWGRWVKSTLLNKAEWHIHTSMNYVTIASDNCCCPVWHQTIAWINADVLLIGSLRTNYDKILNLDLNVSHEHAELVLKLLILSR